jgi:hypothetical protein
MATIDAMKLVPVNLTPGDSVERIHTRERDDAIKIYFSA